MPTDCDSLPIEYLGKAVAEVRILAVRLNQISIDHKNWVRILRCRVCGQLWEEWYTQTGHGELANVRKMQMTPYEVISRMSHKMQGLTLTDRRDYLWQNVPWLAETISRALVQFAGGTFLESATMYLDDPSYRQSATAVVLTFRFDVADPFAIKVHCLIDHGGIAVRVASPPRDPRFERVRSLIEQKASNAAEVQLRELGVVDDASPESSKS